MKAAFESCTYRDATSARQSNQVADLKVVALWAALGLTLTALFVMQGADIAQSLGMAG